MGSDAKQPKEPAKMQEHGFGVHCSPFTWWRQGISRFNFGHQFDKQNVGYIIKKL
jgi:hypothetical protein